MKVWRMVSIAEFIIYIVVSLFLFLRVNDGAGAANTLEVKMISFAVWTVFNFFIFFIQWVWYKRIHKNKRLK
ncbi:DUF3923 family protein [Facklamia sp. DSM 111018]|uniref:DUF3923 family protein n=1 Tax=Facklamia lactis TaxID=2749967 RepID=A0ABS0LRU9_9LACT|nr:DUF3923 family protein [Facklamia lactis]MBG9980196.1 DUF3923 family protein [Facklamia lactis]MBG9985999.1 DUF3923 family protein [Facklamia lactis]